MKIKVSLFFISLSFILLSAIYFDKQSKVQLFIQDHDKSLEVVYNSVYKHYKSYSQEIFDNHINQKNTIDILENIEKYTRDISREKLLKEHTKLYNSLKENGIRQLHFHTPDNRSLLRFHRPSKYDDNLNGVRKTVEFVNKNQKSINSFEEGRIFNGFRFIYPIFSDNGRYLGSVEISVSPENMIASIADSYDNLNSDFIIKKNFVDNKVFNDEKNTNYTLSRFSKEFYSDSIVTNLNKSYERFNYIIASLTENEKQEIDKNLSKNRIFNTVVKLKDNSHTILTFLPIANKVTNQTVAYFVFAADSKYISTSNQSYKFAYVIAIFVSLLISYLFFLLLKNRYEISSLLENEKKLNTKYKKQNILHNKAQRLAKIGHWEYDHKNDKLYWSDEVYRIFDIDKVKNEKNLNYNFFKSLIYKDDLEKLKTSFEESIENQTQYQNIHRVKKSNGEIRYIEEICFHEYDKNGDVLYSIGTAQDITTLEIHENERKKLVNIIEQLPLSVVITDKNGLIEYINPFFTKLTGYTKDEVYNKTPNVLKSGVTDNDTYKIIWDTLLIDKLPYECEFENIKKDGSHYIEKAILFPLLDSYRNVINLVGIKQDITKYKELNKQLKEQQDMLIINAQQSAINNILSNIAHHWRQPLAAIGASLNTIYTIEAFGESLDENKDTISQSIKLASEKLQSLSMTIEQFSSYFNQSQSTIGVVNIKELIDDVLDIFSIKLQEINVTKDLELVSSIYSNKSELIQIISSIIDNSCYFLNFNKIENKQIDIKLNEDDNQIYICIFDNAGGVNEKILPKIYEPYFSTKAEKNQTGLGLYVAKTIIKQLNGEINVENYQDGLKVTLSIKKI